MEKSNERTSARTTHCFLALLHNQTRVFGRIHGLWSSLGDLSLVALFARRKGSSIHMDGNVECIVSIVAKCTNSNMGSRSDTLGR